MLLRLLCALIAATVAVDPDWGFDLVEAPLLGGVPEPWRDNPSSQDDEISSMQAFAASHKGPAVDHGGGHPAGWTQGVFNLPQPTRPATAQHQAAAPTWEPPECAKKWPGCQPPPGAAQ